MPTATHDTFGNELTRKVSIAAMTGSPAG
jgi:hypothetical protein